MTTTPAGARAGDWHNADPQPWRIVRTRVRRAGGVPINASALQFEDGGIDCGSMQPPQVWVDDRALSSGQARELAALLIEAADQVDGWGR